MRSPDPDALVSIRNLVPADYDGDGKDDLTVFRPSDGIWYILRSFNNQYSAFQFGLAGDIPQPGDWDRDGVMDLGVYRPGTNVWYTSDTDYAVAFGTAGDNPVATVNRAN